MSGLLNTCNPMGAFHTRRYIGVLNDMSSRSILSTGVFANLFIGVYILLTGRRNGLPLPWLGEESWPRLVISYDILILCYLLYKISCTASAIVASPELEVKIYLLGASMFFVFGIYPCIFFAVNGTRWRKIIETVDSLNERIMTGDLGGQSRFADMYNDTAAGLTKLSRGMAVATIGCAAFYCTSVPFIDYMNGSYGQRTAVPVQCLEKYFLKYPGVFETIVIEQVIAYTIPGFHKYVTDYIVVSLLKIHAAYFSYLSTCLEDIGKEMAIKGKATERFITWIKLHQDALTNFHELESVFSSLVIMYCLCTIILVAGTLMYQMEAKNSNILQAIFGGSYMSMAMVQLLMVCHAADEASTQAENIAIEAYNMPWFNLDERSKGYIKLVINMANRPIHLDGYRSPAFRLNKEAFLALFVNTVSAYMGFRKIREISNLVEDEI